MAVLFGAGEVRRNHDVHFPFRQDSNFQYLTGLNEPDSILVLCPQNSEYQSVLFVRPKDPVREMWEGSRLGPELAKELAGVDKAFPLDKWEQLFPSLLAGHHTLYCDLHHKTNRDRVLRFMKPPIGERKRPYLRPENLGNVIPAIGGLRLFKGPEEIEHMKRAADISSLAHRAAMALASSKVSESEVQALMEYIMHREGGRQLAYPSIVAGGKNALVLHYTDNRSPLNEGDLLLIDAGVEINGYASDITRTFPVSSSYSPPQKEMYCAVLAGQKKAIAMGRPGKMLQDVHKAAVYPIVEWMVEKAILKGKVEQIVEREEYKKYYVHSTGHWLGLDVHDHCPYQDQQNNDIKLAPGMVYTVEPGLYFPIDDPAVPKEFRGLGIRIEDDILITQSGQENLTQDIPKSIEEVEEACRRNHKDFL